MADITIRNEDEAWDFYEKATRDKLGQFGDILNIRFLDWPKFHIHIDGKDFDQSVPTRIMPSLLELQKEVHRAYCLLKYGDENIRQLTQDEREQLEVVVQVGAGSSDFMAKLEGILNRAVDSGIERMDPRHILILLLSFGLMWTGRLAWQDWLQQKADEAQIESRVKMSELERDKLELFAEAAKVLPEAESIRIASNEFRNSTVGKLKAKDEITVPGTDTKIDGLYASQITSKPREQSEEIRIDGEFLILSVDSGSLSGYKLKVRRVLDGSEFSVRIPDSTLETTQLQVLSRSEWAKKPVILEINARRLRGEITAANLVSAKQPDPPNT